MSSVSPTSTATTTWTVDPTHTSAEFSVRHLMISTVKGRFAAVSGTVTTDGTDLSKGTVAVDIEVASIDTREPQRDAHLKSADFFDAENHPKITFRSTAINRTSPDEDFTIVGDLTIRGTTREVTLAVTPEGAVKDPWGNDRIGFSATTKVKRSDYGLVWNLALETGGVVVGEEVKISLDVELIKQA